MDLGDPRSKIGPPMRPQPSVFSNFHASLGWLKNHVEERLLDQAHAVPLYTPPPTLLGGRSRSIPQGMI